MGIFVGSKQEVSAFRSSGGLSSIKKKGVVATTNIRNAASGISNPGGSSIFAKAAQAFAPVRVASGVLTADKIAAKMKASPVQNVPQSGNTIIDKALSFVKKHPVLTAGAAALAVGGTALAVRAVRKRKKKSAATKRRKLTSSKRRARVSPRSTRKRARRSYGTEAQYKRRGGLDVKYTRNGQPYVIQRNGRARFIKRSR